jgi:hypothetical protein
MRIEGLFCMEDNKTSGGSISAARRSQRSNFIKFEKQLGDIFDHSSRWQPLPSSSAAGSSASLTVASPIGVRFSRQQDVLQLAFGQILRDSS